MFHIRAVWVALPKASKKATTSSSRLSSMMMTLLSGMQTYSAKAPSRSNALVKPIAGPGLELRQVPVPDPGPGQVLIKIHKTAICGTDGR